MRFRTRLGASALALGLIFGACGGGDDVSEDPKGALEAALDNLGGYEGVRFTLSLATTPASLVAASEGELDEEQAQKFIDSSLVIAAKEGETPDEGQFEMAADVAGIDNAVEVRAVDKVLYVRAEVEALVEEFGGDISEINKARQQFGSQPGFEFIGPALDGDWIGLTGFEEALEQLTGQSATETPSEEDLRILQEFADALKQNVSAEAGDREGPGAHVVAGVPLRATYEEFVSLAQNLGQLPPEGFPPASEVPDENVEVDVWIDGGHIRQIELDFIKIAALAGEPAPEGVEEFALRLGIEEFTDDVQVPDDVTNVDVMQLMQGFLGGLGGLEGESEAETAVPAELCEELASQMEGQPDEVKEQIVAQFGADCPELANQ